MKKKTQILYMMEVHSKYMISETIKEINMLLKYVKDAENGYWRDFFISKIRFEKENIKFYTKYLNHE